MRSGESTRQVQSAHEAAKATAIAFTRIFLGVMWLFEVTVGHNWKIGGFGSDVHPGWIGALRGTVVREEVAHAIADGTWAWFAWIYAVVFVPNAELISWFTVAFQVTLGVAFIIGVFVRPLAVLALGMDLSIFMLGNSRIPPFFTAMHLFVLATGAGRYYGLDGWLTTRVETGRSAAARTLGWLLDLPFADRRWRGVAFGAAAFVAVYFFLAIPQRPTIRMQFVSMELAAIAAILAVALYASSLISDRLGVIVAALRIFVGFKFLHEIWARVTPGVNALPGWAGGEQLGELFATIAANHWGLVSWAIATFFLPYATFWAILFGTVQFVVGVMLVLGIRTRFASLSGAAFLAVLIVLGMTRYPPFLLGILIPVIALDGGRVLSVDRMRAGEGYRERFGLPIPRAAILPLLVLMAANAIAAIVTASVQGIEPGTYIASMPAMTTAMVAIFSALLAFAGCLQLVPQMCVTPARCRDLIAWPALQHGSRDRRVEASDPRRTSVLW